MSTANAEIIGTSALAILLALTGCDKTSTPQGAQSDAAAPPVVAPLPLPSAPASAPLVTAPCDHTSLTDCEQKCSAGSADACGFVDGILTQKGATDEPARRAKANQKGCDLGDGQACSRLGTQYSDGVGVAKDRAKAIQTWELACSKAYANGCYKAGFEYQDPREGKQDLAKAQPLLEKGCALGNKSACTRKDDPWKVVDIEDLIVSPGKFVGKHVFLLRVAVHRSSATSGTVFKPGASAAVDGVSAIVNANEETRKKWLHIGNSPSGETVKFIEADVEKVMSRDERARLVVSDLGRLEAD